MPSPCNSINVTPIKVSQLVRYRNIDVTDYILTIESGSALYSRKSTFGDVIGSMKNVTGSYSGSFSGSYWGKINSKNTKASGSFSGSYWGKISSKNTVASGSFSGSYFGRIISKNTVASGSFSGSYFGGVVSKNAQATGSFRGINSMLSGSFSGSYFGNVVSKNAQATGSFHGINSMLSGSFSGSSYGRFIGKNSRVTGSFRGIDNITNFKGTGKKVSFNGTSSYSVSSSYASSASYSVQYDRIPVFGRLYCPTMNSGSTFTTSNVSITLPTGYSQWEEFNISLISNVEDNATGGTIKAELQYFNGVAVTVSSTGGTGNSGQEFYLNNSDDAMCAQWEHFGIVSNARKYDSTLSFKSVVTNADGLTVLNLCMLLKAYAKR